MDFPWSNSKTIEHCNLLANSFFFWTKKDMIEGEFDPIENSFHLYHAPFALVSYGTEENPVFNYANIKAQELWGLDWEAFTQTLSSLSAGEPANKLLSEKAEKGFVSDVNSIRISAKEERFKIKDAILWNIINERGVYKGQAALIPSWEFI